MSKLQKIWRDHSLSIVLISLAAIFLIVTIISGYHEWVADQQTHGQEYPIWEFWRWWTYEFSMSVVADILGALFLVVFTKYFHERGSTESE